jgi:SAM-dependent methyltransferase
MGTMDRMVMQKFYRQAGGSPERLPWHQEHPGAMLSRAVHARGGRGRALDLGCGAGVFSVWLAQQGMEVTGLDLFPEAQAMASTLAAQKGARVNLVCSDLFSYSPDRPFDLVFDSGCLHSLVGGGLASYKQQLLAWLAPGADYVLGHWGKRHAFDWRPIGPKRRSQETLQEAFAPELQLVDTEVADFSAPFPFGPVVRGVGYWFRRPS